MKKIFLVICILAFTLMGFINPDFIEFDPVFEPNIQYANLDDGVYSFKEGIESAVGFFPKSSIYIEGSDSISISNSCIEFVDDNPDIFVVPSEELTLLRAANRLNRWWITFAQTHDGIIVEDGRVDFRIFGSGKLAFCGANIVSTFESSRPSVSLNSAIESIEREYLFGGTLISWDLVYWPDYNPEGTIGRLAWRIDIFQSPEKQFRFYIAAKDSKPLFHYSLVQFYDVWGSASIEYLPRFFDDSLVTGPYQYGEIGLGFSPIVASDNYGAYSVSSYSTTNLPLRARLRGEWADVEDIEDENGLYEFWLRPPSEHTFVFSTEFADTDEINLYYHTTYIHEFYETIDPAMTALDYPVPARAGIESTPENAFWDGYGTNYGSGGSSMRNFALFSNIIYHEYSHGITGWLYEGVYFPYSGQPGAMNEAFSDYFAATNLDDPRIGFKTPRYGQIMFRTMNNNLRMPGDWSGEVHADGRIFGGALWDLREKINVPEADSIIHFTRYAMPNTFNGFVPEALFTDDDDDDFSNGSPNCVSIFEAFAEHGIGPGYFPQVEMKYDVVELGDGDGFYEAGESLAIYPTVIADGSFAWPNIVNLEYTIDLDEEMGINIVFPEIPFDSVIESGDTSIGSPILLSVTDIDTAFFADVVISYSALNITTEIADTFRFLFGFPQALIIDDSPDAAGRNIKYIAGALDKIGVTYFAHRTLSGDIPENLEEFDLVIWFTGDDTSGTSISPSDTAVMAGYLSAGGNLLLSGQNMTWQLDSIFLNTHFGATHKSMSGGLSVKGISSGGFFEDYENIYLFGTQGANNQRKLTSISPSRAEAIAKYLIGDTCAVIHSDGISKTALFSFGIESIGGNSSSVSLAELLFRLMSWFEIPMSTEEEPIQPCDLEIVRISPNPFNSRCLIKGPKGIDKIEIFDLTGRIVAVHSIFTSKNQELIWDGRDSHGEDCPSGTYLVKCTANSTIYTSKAVLIR
ncbi:T9SS type A sorting domain-containing protein [bacterium]|nr:T9SS type A sorting domain-containing protein [bacterium]